MTTMRHKAFRSGVAVTMASFGIQLARIVSTIILARLLDPADFGIVALAIVLVGTTELFSTFGMGAAIIATKHDETVAAACAARFVLTGSVLFTAIVIIGATPFAQIMERPDLASLCSWMSVIVFFHGMALIPKSIMARHMRFGLQSSITVVGSVAKMATSIVLAVLGFGFWSLAIGQIAGPLVEAVLLVALTPNRGWIRLGNWDRTVARDLARFGVVSTGAGMIQYAYNHGDDLTVGKFLGTTQLGFYTQAYNLSNLPVTSITRVVNAVLLPAYSSVRDEPHRLAGAFLDSFRTLAMITIPLAMGMLLLAPEMIIYLLGEKWRESIPILQIFSFMSLMRPLSGATSPLFLTLDKPGLNLRTSVLQLVSMALLIVLLIGPFGTPGVAAGVVSAYGLGFAYNIFQATHRTGVPLRVRQILAQILPIFGATVVMMLVVWSLKRPTLLLVGGTHNALSLILLVIAGMVSYGISLYVIAPRFVHDAFDLVTTMVRRRRRRQAQV